MTRIIFSATFFALLFISAISSAQQNFQYADSVRRANHIPELSYAVINDKAILETSALGHHSVNLPDTAMLNDRFHIGSNTKAMTAFMIAKYVEKGALRWTTKFFDIFPDWKRTSRKEYYDITLKDLLSHRAMIQPFQGENDPAIPGFKGTKQQQRRLFGKFVLQQEPVKPDSTHHFIYSNAGYTLATLMIEKVTNQTWEQLMINRFNHDLHLNIGFSWPENQKNKDTWGHTEENGKLAPVPSNTDYHLDYTEPAGDINIRLKDYIRFIQLNLDGLKGHNNYLKSSTYHFIHEGIPDYSLGWFNVYENGDSFSTHSGTAGTYYSLVQIDRKKGLAYIILTNSFSENTVNSVRLVMRQLKHSYSNHMYSAKAGF
ncbi:serine hydrolase domain-containing protein [Chitinophaga tropicalis]|uniref:Serine hydrolase n=1 Tax=Chitinophaga tropicalis TaxID=2683588 RepID=A0A7K1U516_9BACT|nr:serine hydrolase domain-containing protein [Chitinophaga tropicalis]MVT09457.1 serine hydrolase [Chitinophaga tropicalis]